MANVVGEKETEKDKVMDEEDRHSSVLTKDLNQRHEETGSKKEPAKKPFKLNANAATFQFNPSAAAFQPGGTSFQVRELARLAVLLHALTVCWSLCSRRSRQCQVRCPSAVQWETRTSLRVWAFSRAFSREQFRATTLPIRGRWACRQPATQCSQDSRSLACR